MWTSQVMRVDPQGLCRIWLFGLLPNAYPSRLAKLLASRPTICTAAGAATAQLPVQTPLHWPRCPSAVCSSCCI